MQMDQFSENFKDFLKELSKYVKYKNPVIYLSAIVHKSYAYENNLDYDYERLEFLGDAILESAISEYLFLNYASEDEGSLTILRAQAVQEKTLAKAIKYHDFGQYIALGKGEIKNNGHNKESILADVYEAILAAIYIDSGYVMVQKFLKYTLFRWLKNKEIVGEADYKTQLQEALQGEHGKSATYKVLETKTVVKNNKKQTIFVMGVYDGNTEMMLAKGSAPSKKQASKIAAQNALNKLAINKKNN